MSALLELRDVVVDFDGFKAVDGVNLTSSRASCGS